METTLPWSNEEVDEGRRVARLMREVDVHQISIMMTMLTDFAKLRL